jgi:hypothetical protein
VVEERSAAGPATLEADLPVTDPPATNPPEADLPVTDPPATDPAATNQSATNQSAADTIRRGAAWISDADLLALLADLGVAASGGADEEAACAAEFELLESSESVLIESEAQIAEHIAVGPGLASVLANAVPGAASNWDLSGIAAAYRRLASWAQAGELAAVAEIASRSAAANTRIGTDDSGRPGQLPPEAAAEVALALQMSQPGASDWVDLAVQMRWRLRATGAALSAGTIDLARARIIADCTSVLTDELASEVETRVLPEASSQTTGQLRNSVRRAVIAADPEGAEQRRKDTERRSKIALYPDENGTATLTGSCLPGVHAAAAMARISAMARALKSSGAQGGLDLLRTHIYLGLLLGTMPLIPPPADGPPDGPPPADGPPDNPATHGRGDDNPTDDAATDTQRCDDPRSDNPADEPPPADGPPDDRPSDESPHEPPAEPADPAGQHSPAVGGSVPGPWQDVPAPTDADAPDDVDIPDAAISYLGRAEDTEEDDRAEGPSPDWPPLPAQLPAGPAGRPGQTRQGSPPPGLLDLVVPWSALAGHTAEAGHLNRIGPVTRLQACQLLVLAARSPHTEWRVVITGNDGRAVAVERARPRWHLGSSAAGTATTGVVGRVTIAIRESWLGTPRAADPAGPSPIREITAMVLRAAGRAAARARSERSSQTQADACAHALASDSYRPPPRIRDFVSIRDVTCRFRTCGQPAWRTDLDHTKPWQKGGLTCSCNLGGCCRTHHKIKQLPGWRLEQPRPGVFRWTTPAGRSYEVAPDPYPA